MTSSNLPPEQESSPFDPYMIAFLHAVRACETGYSLTTNGKSVAAQLGVEVAFIEMLTTSARRRRLIQAFYAPAHRNTLRWQISARGQAFLDLNEPTSQASETTTLE